MELEGVEIFVSEAVRLPVRWIARFIGVACSASDRTPFLEKGFDELGVTLMEEVEKRQPNELRFDLFLQSLLPSIGIGAVVIDEMLMWEVRRHSGQY